MHWLDAVRYADTCGFHGDNPIPAWPYRDYVLPRLSRQQAVRRVHARAARRRPAAERDRRAAGRLGLQPSESHVGRGRPPAQGISRQVRRRSRAHAQRRLAGQHDGLRRVPRPQVRSVPVERFLLDEGVLRRHPGDRASCRIAARRAWGTQAGAAERRAAARAACGTRTPSRRGTDAPRRRGRERWVADAAVGEADLHGAMASGRRSPGRGSTRSPRARSTARRSPSTTRSRSRATTISTAVLKTDTRPGDGLVVAGGANPDRETYVVTLKPGRRHVESARVSTSCRTKACPAPATRAARTGSC